MQAPEEFWYPASEITGKSLSKSTAEPTLILLRWIWKLMWQSGPMEIWQMWFMSASAQKTLDQSIRISKPGGKIMVMGVFGKKPVVDMNTLQEAERVLYTSQAHVDEIAVALEYMRDGKINADELITREVTLDTLVEDGFEYLIQHGPENIKVLIKISE